MEVRLCCKALLLNQPKFVLFVLQQEGDKFSCLGFKLVSNTEMEVNIADVYAVNFIGWGLVHESALASLEVSLLDRSSEVKHVSYY